MDDRNTLDRDTDVEKGESGGWSSDPSTVERRDGERRDSGGDADRPPSPTGTPGDAKEDR